MENNHNPMEDDGSLDFLKIPADETNKHFNCPETTQQKLINLTFWVCDSTDGVPIGNYLSQYFANLMLAYFDHWIKEEKRVRYYFRYADDMVFLASTKEELHILLADIKKYLAALKLTLKGNEQIFPIAENRADKHGRGLDFVGFVFYHNQTLMRKSIKQNFCRMAARLNKKLNISARDYKQRLCSWYGWAKVSNSKHLLKTIIKSQFYDTFVLRCKAV